VYKCALQAVDTRSLDGYFTATAIIILLYTIQTNLLQVRASVGIYIIFVLFSCKNSRSYDVWRKFFYKTFCNNIQYCNNDSFVINKYVMLYRAIYRAHYMSYSQPENKNRNIWKIIWSLFFSILIKHPSQKLEFE